jgi:hypothetical protein
MKAEEAWQGSTWQTILWGEAKKKFIQLEKELSPRIDELTREAGALATKFRALYNESQGEFAFKNHDVAKECAEKGHEIEARCTALNREANALRHILEESYREYQTRDYESRRLRRKAWGYESKLWTKRRPTSVMNFDESVIGDDWNVKKFLDTFPQGIFDKIEDIKYEAQPEEDGSLGYVTKNLTGTAKLIRIFPNPSKREFRRTMASMIGSVVYDEFMGDEERRLWGMMHERMMKEHRIVSPYTARKAEGNFRECFALYKTKPHWLEQFDEKAYHFIKIIHNSLPDEEDEDP